MDFIYIVTKENSAGCGNPVPKLVTVAGRCGKKCELNWPNSKFPAFCIDRGRSLDAWSFILLLVKHHLLDKYAGFSLTVM